MSGGVRTGLETALEAHTEEEGAVQSSLFDVLHEEETGKLDAPSPLTKAVGAAPKRTRGKNRRTEAVTAWLLSQHRHPLSVMMEAYSMTPAQLAKSIGIKPDVDDWGKESYPADILLDLFKLQMRMAEAVAPYVAQRQPQAVQVAAAVGVNLAFEGVSLPARGGGSGNSGGGQLVEGEVLNVTLPVKSDG